MKIEWPIWWCLSVESQKALMIYQWENYGLRLTIPPMPGDTRFDTKLENLEEIDKLMRRRPHYSKRAGNKC